MGETPVGQGSQSEHRVGQRRRLARRQDFRRPPGRRQTGHQRGHRRPSKQSRTGAKWSEWTGARATSRCQGPSGVKALSRLVPTSTALLGSVASEQTMIRFAERPTKALSAVTLRTTELSTGPAWADRSDSRSGQTGTRVTEAAEEVLRTNKALDGRLTVDTIREKWELDADLVSCPPVRLAWALMPR